MIFTSNFKIAGHLPQAVAISRGLPQGWRGRVYKALAPSWQLIKIQDPKEYTRRYRIEVLDKLDPQQVLADLGGDDFVMLCWEPPGEFCHRRIVAVWLLKELGIKIEELDPKRQTHNAWLKRIEKDNL